MTPPTAAARVARTDETAGEIRVPEAAQVTSSQAKPAQAPHLRAVPEADAGPALWRDGAFQDDEWTRTGEDEAVGEGPAILPLKRFLAEREALSQRNSPLGVIVEPGEKLDELVPHLTRVTLVVLPFPKFADGRSSSTARLLRERHGFEGEVRAAGDVLIDQMPLMRRCGFDAFEISDPVTRKQLANGLWPDVPFYMQPVGSSRQQEVPAGTRPWARRPA
ncbi:DUF934 domain-containing protein [Chenggangzhangella methanolivorans]|uniref:DUF934 domain-containing protein n=1 Tax=Chenggangzhangella methanolivorans TaxID=1437009 RepID=A0A9E6UJ16_9HYPH|nr:DUF934 domain-containing protein [Chenggangzhangella methanolivorans]QZO01473.1 DUF934 domain-containing protein [Chenggangzhangella methanolivorans]